MNSGNSGGTDPIDTATDKMGLQTPLSVAVVPLLDLLSFFILALLVRLVVSAMTSVIYPDGAIYLEMAADFNNGHFEQALRRVFHPAFPALIALLHKLSPWTLELTGFLVAAIFGALLVVPLMQSAAILAHRLGFEPRKAAAGAGLFAAIHSSLLLNSSQVLAYSVSHLGIGLALWLALRAAVNQKKEKWSLLLCGASTALAYLARPDALLMMTGFGCTSLAIGLLSKGSLSAKFVRAVTLAAIFSLAALSTASPYIVWVSKESGRLRLTLKKDPEAWLRGANKAKNEAPKPFAKLRKSILEHDRAAKLRTQSWSKSFARAGRQSLKALGGSLLILTLLSVLALKTQKRFLFMVLCPALVLFLGHVFLHFHAGYLSRRHCSYHAVLFIPFGVLGLLWLTREAQGRFGRLQKYKNGPLLTVFAVLLCLPYLPTNFRWHLSHKAIAREFGQWIVKDAGQGARTLLIGDEVRTVAYYAGAEFIDLANADKEKSRIDEARLSGSVYYVLYLRTRKKNMNPSIPKQLKNLGGELAVKKVVSRRDLRYHWWILRLGALPNRRKDH
jgi:hypothetical protein